MNPKQLEQRMIQLQKEINRISDDDSISQEDKRYMIEALDDEMSEVEDMLQEMDELF